MSRIKHKNPKIKVVSLVEIAKKAADKGEFVIIDDPNYEIDDFLGCC